MPRPLLALLLTLGAAACSSDNASTSAPPGLEPQRPDLSTPDMPPPPTPPLDMHQTPPGADDMQRSDAGDMPPDAKEEDLSPPADMTQVRDMTQPLDISSFPPVSNAPLSPTTRPAAVVLPAGFDNTEALPLVIALHGYTGSGRANAAYLQMTQNVDAKRFVLVIPEGTKDTRGASFWNATDACCGFGSQVNDEAYLRALIEEASARFRIDRGKVYLVGHSNGGFMAYHMACKAADLITGIFSLAGATYADPNDCAPSRPVHILQMHGTADGTIAYQGGHAGGFPQIPRHPGALETATLWAGYNGCDPTLSTQPPGPLSGVSPYPMTLQVATGCQSGGSVELWTMTNGVHNPRLLPPLGPRVLDHLFAHDRTP